MSSIHQQHETMLKSLEQSPEEMMEYLLDSTEFLKMDDQAQATQMWENKFKTKKTCPRPRNPDICPECSSAGVQCVETNTVVCPKCSTILHHQLLLNDMEHMSHDTMKRLHRKTVHFYDRYTHFKDYVQRLTGTATYKLLPEDAKNLQATLNGFPAVTPKTVEHSLRKRKLTKKYLVHAVGIAKELGKHEPAYIDGTNWTNLKLAFLRLSKYWHWNRKRVAPKRKSFLNYPFVFYQLAKNLGHPEWTKDVRMPKHYQTLLTLRKIWFTIAKELGWTCYPCT